MNDIQNPLPGAETNTFTVPANSQMNIPATGTFVRCIESTEEVELSFNHGTKTFFTAGVKRDTAPGKEFSDFQITNNSGSDVTITVTYGYGNVEDNRLTVTGALNIAGASNISPQSDVTATNGTDTTVINANLSRKSVWIQSPEDNTGEVRLSAASGEGNILYPGSLAVIETTAAISVYNESGADQTITVTEFL